MGTAPSSDTTAGPVIVGCSSIVADAGRYVLVRETKPSARSRFNLPAGKPEVGETLVEAAVREAREESGLEVAIDHLVGIYHCPLASEGFGVVNFVFAASPVGGELTGSPEHPEVGWFTRDEIADLARRRLVRGTHIERAIADHERGVRLELSLVQLTEPSPLPPDDASCPAADPRRSGVYHPHVPDTTTRVEDTLVRGYRQLALETPARQRDALLRALDVVLSTLLVVVTLPLTVAIALLVLATGGPPILYRGERVGRGGHVFTMLKFRTLKPGAERRLGPYLGEELVRRTQVEFAPIGRWLKATQLDELPQFWNVLRGDMSLVGPRPIRPVFFEELAHDLPAYWQRLVVRPGLTGFAQVRRGYETSMAEKLAHDLEWIADRSVRLYLRTVAATAWRVVRQSLRGLVRPDA